MKDRVVLITGGTSGIGLETVRRFAAEGCRVATCARTPFDFEELLGKELAERILFRTLDVAVTSDLINWIDQVTAEAGRLDVFVNNSAAVVRKPLVEFSSEEVQRSLDVNLRALLEGTRAAIERFDPQRGGTLVNLSSMAAVDPFEGFSVYGACKAFVELFTRAVASEVAPRGIRCFAVRAGAVETPLLRRVLPDYPEASALDPSHVGRLIFDLCTETTGHLSGDSIEISSETPEGIAALSTRTFCEDRS